MAFYDFFHRRTPRDKTAMPTASPTFLPNRPKRILLLFIDGLGLLPARHNQIYTACPELFTLLLKNSIPLCATLETPGIPQSATGQTSIFTGINAAKQIGHHQQGFPSRPLRLLIQKYNIFQQLQRQGCQSGFANAYVRRRGMELPIRLQSVTTVATLATLGGTRNRAELLRGEAVYHDITRQTLPTHGISDIPPITEEQAAEHLLAILRTLHFCLFEFFLTDHAGHRDDWAETQKILVSLNRFITAIMSNLDPQNELFLLVSDHGNIESPGHLHTCNPVPWLAYGAGEKEAKENCNSITDVTPKILELLPKFEKQTPAI